MAKLWLAVVLVFAVVGLSLASPVTVATTVSLTEPDPSLAISVQLDGKAFVNKVS